MSALASPPLPLLLLLAAVCGIILVVFAPRGARSGGSGGAAVWVLAAFILAVAGLGVWILVRAIRFTGFDFLH